MITEEQYLEAQRIIDAYEEQLRIANVSNCNILKTYALINRKDGLTDVWCEGKCLGEGLDTDGINKLDL